MGNSSSRAPDMAFTPAHAPSVRVRQLCARLADLAAGATLLTGLWMVTSFIVPEFPSPAATWQELINSVMRAPSAADAASPHLMALLLASLVKALQGFAVGVALAAPLGLLAGSWPLVWRVLEPAAQLLRPVSPIALFPLTLTVLERTSLVTLVIIAFTAFWPVLLATSRTAGSLPEDIRNVVRAFNVPTGTYITRVLVPAAVPSTLTAARASFSVAWRVVVATEVLSGEPGIGSFILSAWKAARLDEVASAVVLTGLVGFLMDRALATLGRSVSHA